MVTALVELHTAFNAPIFVDIVEERTVFQDEIVDDLGGIGAIVAYVYMAVKEAVDRVGGVPGLPGERALTGRGA